MADNPYEKIGSVVEQWCKDHVYTQMLVTISIGYDWEPPHEETHLLDFDSEKGNLIWDSDWWEGQQHVELVGFTPLYKVRLKGEGEYARTVRHGRWENINDLECFKCSCCGEYANQPWGKDGAIMFSYCPNCGCKMDGGDTSERQAMAVQSQND